MDALSVAGLALAAVAILGGQWLEGGHLGSLIQPAAFLIVVGGTTAAVLLQSRVSTFVEGMRLGAWAFRPPPIDHAGLIGRVEAWAVVARRDGVLALERELDAIDEPYLRNGVQLLVDGLDPDRIRESLEVAADASELRLKAAAKVWEAAGGYSPTIGILGAVMGLIHVMENLSDPAKLGGGIAVAFVATIYGVGLANLVFLPLAAKLKALIAAQSHYRAMIADGLLGIANGDNPKLIAARLAGHLG
ncbi:MAG: flagellar motor protein [Burkholderiales bacterium]